MVAITPFFRYNYGTIHLEGLSMKTSIAIISGLLLAACGQSNYAQDIASAKPNANALPTFNTYTAAQRAVLAPFGMLEFDASKISAVPLKDGFAVIFGYGGNVLVSVGDDGVIMVDNQFPEIYEALLDEVRKLGGEKVDYVINTHWHFDHAEGNRAFGPLGAQIIAHENSAAYMAGDHNINLVVAQYPQQAYPPEARPDRSYSDTLELSLNGQDIILYNFGPAHTTGDSQVYFRTGNILHMGDVGNFTPSPFIDVDNGGDVDGVIATVRAMLDIIDEETIVVPGHGDIGNKARLIEYVEWLEAVRAQVAALKAQGKTIEEIQTAYAEGKLEGAIQPMVSDRIYHSID